MTFPIDNFQKLQEFNWKDQPPQPDWSDGYRGVLGEWTDSTVYGPGCEPFVDISKLCIDNPKTQIIELPNKRFKEGDGFISVREDNKLKIYRKRKNYYLIKEVDIEEGVEGFTFVFK